MMRKFLTFLSVVFVSFVVLSTIFEIKISTTKNFQTTNSISTSNEQGSMAEIFKRRRKVLNKWCKQRGQFRLNPKQKPHLIYFENHNLAYCKYVRLYFLLFNFNYF